MVPKADIIAARDIISADFGNELILSIESFMGDALEQGCLDASCSGSFGWIETMPDDVLERIVLMLDDVRDRIMVVMCVSKRLKERFLRRSEVQGSSQRVWEGHTVNIYWQSYANREPMLRGYWHWWQEHAGCVAERISIDQRVEKYRDESCRPVSPYIGIFDDVAKDDFDHDDDNTHQSCCKKGVKVHLHFPVTVADVQSVECILADRLIELWLHNGMDFRAPPMHINCGGLYRLQSLVLDGRMKSSVIIGKNSLPLSLEHLEIRNSYIAGPCESLLEFTSLCTMRFHHCLVSSSLTAWMRPVMRMSWLRELEVQKCAGSGSVSSNTGSAFGVLGFSPESQLTKLCFEGSNIDCQLDLENLRYLQSLDIRGCQLDSLVRVHGERLQSLKMSGNQRNVAFSSISDELHLRELDIDLSAVPLIWSSLPKSLVVMNIHVGLPGNVSEVENIFCDCILGQLLASEGPCIALQQVNLFARGNNKEESSGMFHCFSGSRVLNTMLQAQAIHPNIQITFHP